MGNALVQTANIPLKTRSGGFWGSVGYTQPVAAWAYAGIPYITVGNNLSTPWPYNPTAQDSLAHPAFPSDWSSEVAGFYYVDSKTGTAVPTWGTPSAPLNRIPRIVAAGSVVVMAPGEYTPTHTSPEDITFTGTSVSPCWIVPYDINSKPVCRAKWEVNGTHAIIERVNAASADPVNDTTPMGMNIDSASYITVRECDWSGNQGGVSLNGDGGWGISNSSYIYLVDNKIHDCGDLSPTVDIDEHGVNVATSDDIWIIRNELYNCSGDSIQIGGQDVAGPLDTNRVYAAGNICHGNRQTGIWVKEATDVIVSTNIAYNMTNGSFAEALCFGGQYDHDNVWFINNICHSSKGGFKFQSGTGDQYVIGNIIYDLTGPDVFDINDPNSAHAITARGGNNYIVNNTVHNCHAGVSITVSTTGVLENNFFGAPTTLNASSVFLFNTSLKTSNFNAYEAANDSSVVIRFGGATQQSLVNFKAGGFEADAVTTPTPLFVDAGNNNFTLGAGSPLINAGEEVNVYSTFLSRYGDSINKDRNGVTRPVSLWDIGAFEKVS